MIKKIAYILIPACATISVAGAETMLSNPTLLSAGEMDQVTAGLTASVDAGAVAFSPVLAITKTDTTAMVAPTGNSNPGLTGGGAIAGGEGLAGAAGNGSATGTSVTPTTDLSGPTVYAIQLNVDSSGGLSDVSGSAIVAVSAPYVSPF